MPYFHGSVSRLSADQPQDSRALGLAQVSSQCGSPVSVGRKRRSVGTVGRFPQTDQSASGYTTGPCFWNTGFWPGLAYYSRAAQARPLTVYHADYATKATCASHPRGPPLACCHVVRAGRCATPGDHRSVASTRRNTVLFAEAARRGLAPRAGRPKASWSEYLMAFTLGISKRSATLLRNTTPGAAPATVIRSGRPEQNSLWELSISLPIEYGSLFAIFFKFP